MTRTTRTTRIINLEKYIEFPSTTDKVEGFSGINFHFNSQIIAKIEQARQRGHGLHISRKLQTKLRCCSLIGLESYLQSGLSICTYYQQEDREEAVIKSLLSPDGDIMHQISSYYLHHHQLCTQITSTHYWLMQQLTLHLAWQRTRLGDYLAWLVAILAMLGLLVAYPQGIFTNLMALGIVILLTWGLQKLCKVMFGLGTRALDNWAIAQFLILSSSSQLWQQEMAKLFLKYLVV